MLLTRPESGPTRTSTSMSMIVGGGRNRIARLSSPRPIGWWAPLRSARLSRLHSALAPPVGPGAPGGCDLGPQADGRCRARVVRHGDRHRALVSELYAVGWRVRARPQQWVWSVLPSLGRRFAWRAAMRLCGYAACDGGGRWRVYGTRVAAVGDGPVEVVLGQPAGRGAPDASTGLTSEQQIEAPACPRCENGHLWRFDRERSTRDCQADVC